MKCAKKTDSTTIRMPDELKLQLKHLAIDNRRSLNEEIVYRLEQTVKQDAGNAEHTSA